MFIGQFAVGFFVRMRSGAILGVDQNNGQKWVGASAARWPAESPVETLESRIKTVLPPQYEDCYEEVQPISMGSAGLRYDATGQVAWNEIWGSFCDLAMAGGPPHKGTLLLPGTESDPTVVAEICRGIQLVTGLPADQSPTPGWVRVGCDSPTMADWLCRAINMENVSARCEDSMLELPAGPGYRLEKEIKNVITVIAKTCHYWVEHMWTAQQREIAALFTRLARDFALIQPSPGDGEAIADAIHQATGLLPSAHHYPGWLGFECVDVPTAIWMMRALVVSNVLARREETVLFVPVHSNGEAVIQTVVQVHSLALGHVTSSTPQVKS